MVPDISHYLPSVATHVHQSDHTRLNLQASGALGEEMAGLVLTSPPTPLQYSANLVVQDVSALDGIDEGLGLEMDADNESSVRDCQGNMKYSTEGLIPPSLSVHGVRKPSGGNHHPMSIEGGDSALECSEDD